MTVTNGCHMSSPDPVIGTCSCHYGDFHLAAWNHEPEEGYFAIWKDGKMYRAPAHAGDNYGRIFGADVMVKGWNEQFAPPSPEEIQQTIEDLRNMIGSK